MADDKNLRDLLALKFAGYGKKTQSPAQNLAVADQEVEIEERTSSSDEAFNYAGHFGPAETLELAIAADHEVDAGHIRKKLRNHFVPAETQDLDVAADQEVDAGHIRKKLRTHLVPAETQTVAVAADQKVDAEDHAKTCFLLIGHADLVKLMHDVDSFLKIKEGPEELTAGHLRCIETLNTQLNESGALSCFAFSGEEGEDVERMKAFVSAFL